MIVTIDVFNFVFGLMGLASIHQSKYWTLGKILVGYALQRAAAEEMALARLPVWLIAAGAVIGFLFSTSAGADVLDEGKQA